MLKGSGLAIKDSGGFPKLLSCNYLKNLGDHMVYRVIELMSLLTKCPDPPTTLPQASKDDMVPFSKDRGLREAVFGP